MTESDAGPSGRAPVEPPPTPEQIAEYRQALERLMARCLERISRAPVPVETEPLQTWRPGD